MNRTIRATEGSWPSGRSGQEQYGREEGSSRGRKRARYITRACNECKRRKIKCNGQAPCRGCQKRESQCEYPPSSDRVTKIDKQDPEKDIRRLYSHINSLQKQVSELAAAISVPNQATTETGPEELEAAQSLSASQNFQGSQVSRAGISPKWSFSPSHAAAFQGPITSAFSFNIAKSNLKSRGIIEANDGNLTQGPSPAASPLPSAEGSAHSWAGQNADPLSFITRDEACRLCHVYNDEMGIMYPVLSLKQVLQLVDAVYNRRTSSSGGEAARRNCNTDHLRDGDEALLKMALACGLTAEAEGRSDLALGLFNSVADVVKDYMWRSPDLAGTMLLMVVAMFYFQMDEETLAWRIIGTVQRMCLEMGLHRQDTLREPAVVQFGSERVINLFWSVYVLDMRWSLGTGMRCALQDIDIDTQLPEPDESAPYLKVMIHYSRIAAKVWDFVAAFNNTNQIKSDELAYLDWQILQWAKSIPKSLQLQDETNTEHELAGGKDVTSRGLLRLRSLLYLRTRQLRILLYRPILHSASRMSCNVNETDTVVDIAIDTIRHLTHLHKTSDFYQLQQVAFNWFLVSALAVLFLAVAQAPAEYSNRCRTEFYMALELVKSLATNSYVSKRLWRSIKSLKMLAAKVGMHKGKETDSTLRAAPLEGESVTIPGAVDISQRPDQPMDLSAHGMQMSQELMDWFEAVGDLEDPLSSFTMQETANAMADQSANVLWEDYLSSSYGEGLSSIMRDCF